MLLPGAFEAEKAERVAEREAKRAQKEADENYSGR